MHGRTIGAAVMAIAAATGTAFGAGDHVRPSAQSAHGHGGVRGPGLGLKDLVRMGPAELEGLYRSAGPGRVPGGKVKGRAILMPGSPAGPAVSGAARLLWQGKVFDEDGRSSVNRFGGVRIVRATVYGGPSWLDGRPATILDYSRTSRVYADVRDEIREVAPGLYLGLMYATDQPRPDLRMYFALEDRP